MEREVFEMKKRLVAILLVLTLLVFGIPAGAAFADTGDDADYDSHGPEYVENRVLVMYEEGAIDTDTPDWKVFRQSADSIHVASTFGESSESLGSEEVIKTENTLDQQTGILSKSLDDYQIEDTMTVDAVPSKPNIVISVISSDTMSTEEMIKRLSGQAGILYVEPDYIVHTEDVPDWDDTYLKDMHHLMGDTSIHADEIWESKAYAEANANDAAEPVIVAVVDTGVDYTHPDLKNRMWVKPDSRAFSQFAGKYGFDFVDNDYDPMDEADHGTHCAGIIAAQANNAEGITGVAGISDQVQIMAVRVLGADGSGYSSDIIAGMRYVVEMKKAGANVVAMNCSLGGPSISAIYNSVIDAAGQAGVLTFVAAGNESVNIDLNSVLPADAVSDYRITVSASDDNGYLASYSNYGVKRSDIVAPGSNILSTVSSYNFAPYLYDAKTIRGYVDETGTEHAGNTEYYGEFDGADIVQVKNVMGEVVDAVTPVTGTDYFGNLINDPADPDHQVGRFGQSVMLADRVDGSSGKATLEITDDENFPIGANEKYLRWKISDAKAGDVYILYFPYDKTTGDQSNVAINMAYRTTSAYKDGGQGVFFYGDIKVNGIDQYGNVNWTHYDPKGDDKGVAINYTKNSLWRAGQYKSKVYPYQDIMSVKDNGGEDLTKGYGLGAVYRVNKDGDIYIDFSSLGISRCDANETTFGKYNVFSGTSMATPTAAGFAAIIAVMYPQLSALELKNTVLSSTDDRYPGWCSTGGMIDFRYLEISEENSKPTISKAVAAFEEKTVTLYGQGFGTAPNVKFLNNLSGEGVVKTISLNDLSADSESITIRNADQYGIIGSDITFYVENTENGKSGTGTFYVVNGLASYQAGYAFPIMYDDNYDTRYIEEGNIIPDGAKFIAGAGDLLMYDPAGNVYGIGMDQSTGKWSYHMIGDFMENFIYRYIQMILLDPLGSQTLWHTARRDTGNLSYSVIRLSNPVCLGDTIYELVRVNMGYVNATLMLTLNLETQEWSLCYDSILGYGEKPQDFSFDEIKETTLAAYKGRLYLFGSVLSQEAYAGDPQPEWTASTEVLSFEPDNSAITWVRESASLPTPVAGGTAITQGGNLYYLLTNINSKEMDLNVYRFNGQEWSVAGTLPYPRCLFRVGGETAHYSTNTVTYETRNGIECAVGIDEEGILLGGSSFDKSGDTFRFNTSTGETQALGYTFWETNSQVPTVGTSAGSRLWVHYPDTGIGYYLGACIDISNGYVTLQKSVSGDGSGSVSGAGSYSKGDTSKAVITPADGSYIYSAVSNGMGQDINLEEITSDYAKNVQERMEPFTANYDAMTDGTLDVVFGVISTKVNAEAALSKEVGTWDLGFSTNGTISGVDLTSSNTDYAVINKDGTVTFCQAGAGKTVTITAAAKDDPTVKAKCKVTILEKKKKSVSDAKISGIKNKTYTGNAITQNITVKIGSKTLTKGTDYTVSYKNNVNAGTAAMTIKGKGDYTGTADRTFEITPKKVTPQVTLSPTSMAYSGKAQKPAVTVKLSGKKLASSSYSMIWSSGRKNVGIYNVTVQLKGNYSGSKSESFQITKAANSITKVTPSSTTLKYRDVKKKAQSFQLKAKDLFGAKMTYSLDSKTSAAAKKYITVSNTGKVTVKMGTPKSTYTIKVKVSAQGTKNYKAASVVKNVKIIVK